MHIPALDCSRWSSCQAKFFPRVDWRFRVRSSSKGGGKLEKLAPGNLNYWLQTYWRNSFYDGVIQDHQFAMVNVLLHKMSSCPSKLRKSGVNQPPKVQNIFLHILSRTAVEAQRPGGQRRGCGRRKTGYISRRERRPASNRGFVAFWVTHRKSFLTSAQWRTPQVQLFAASI